jgi:hypothetical protein
VRLLLLLVVVAVVRRRRLRAPALLLLLLAVLIWWQHWHGVQVDAFAQAYQLAAGLPGQCRVLRQEAKDAAPVPVHLRSGVEWLQQQRVVSQAEDKCSNSRAKKRCCA